MSQSWNYLKPETKVEIELTAKRRIARLRYPNR
jgi:hypothetical protein